MIASFLKWCLFLGDIRSFSGGYNPGKLTWLENGHVFCWFLLHFLLKNGDAPASYVSLPEGKVERKFMGMMKWDLMKTSLIFCIPSACHAYKTKSFYSNQISLLIYQRQRNPSMFFSCKLVTRLLHYQFFQSACIWVFPKIGEKTQNGWWK